MLSALPSDLLLIGIVRRVIFSTFTGALWLLLALGILRLLNVKNPAVKHIFYALALSKGFIALVREQPHFIQPRGRINLAVQFPDPFAIMPDFLDIGIGVFRGSFSIAFGPGLAVLTAAIIFLGWRFFGLVRFFQSVNTAPELDRATHTGFYEILDRVAEQARVASPKVISIDSNGTPFTVGLRRPIIAFSPWLLNHLDSEEIEAVLAHELGHIARRDYLYHWPIVVMRDVLFFNPLTYVMYRRLSFERERACDDFSSKLCQPLALAKSLIKVAEAREGEPALGLIRSFAPLTLLEKGRQSNFSRRVTELIEPKPYTALSRPRRLFLWLGSSIFFYMEIHIVALINGVGILLS